MRGSSMPKLIVLLCLILLGGGLGAQEPIPPPDHQMMFLLRLQTLERDEEMSRRKYSASDCGDYIHKDKWQKGVIDFAVGETPNGDYESIYSISDTKIVAHQLQGLMNPTIRKLPSYPYGAGPWFEVWMPPELFRRAPCIKHRER